MRCESHWNNGCQNQGEVRLVAPGMTADQCANLGAYCPYCANRIVSEYAEKLGEQWDMVPVDSFGDLIRKDGEK